LLLREGNGGVVNASRSLLKAWVKEAEAAGRAAAEVDLTEAASAARNATLAMRDALRATPAGRVCVPGAGSGKPDPRP